MIKTVNFIKAQKDATAYFSKCKMSPDQDDLLEYYMDWFENESGYEPSESWVKEQMGYVEEEVCIED